MVKDTRPEFISISEMARLRNVSAETLRHYDRIGLLKPDYTDQNGMRFYSVLMYEKLQTIKELKQIGMSLADIRSYFENRDFQTSYELIRRQDQALDETIRELLEVQRQVKQKKAYMEAISPDSYAGKIFIQDIPDRYYFTLNQIVHDEIELSYQLMQMENQIYEVEKYAPLYATQRYAGLIPGDSVPGKGFERELIIFIGQEKASLLKSCKKLSGGRFCCVRAAGTFWDQDAAIERLFAYLEQEHFTCTSDHIVEKVIVDYTISDKLEERLYEFQIRI